MAHEYHPNQIKKQASKNTSSGRLDSFWELTYPHGKALFEDDVSFPKVGYVGSLECFQFFCGFLLFPQKIDVETRMENVHTNIGL